MSQTWLQELYDEVYPPKPEALSAAPTPEPHPWMARLLSRVEDAHSELRALRGEVNALTELCTEFLSKRAARRSYHQHYDTVKRVRQFPPGKTWQDVAAMFDDYGERGSEEVAVKHGFPVNSVSYWMRAYAEKHNCEAKRREKLHQIYSQRSTTSSRKKQVG